MKIRHKLLSVPLLAVALMAAVVAVAAWGLTRQQSALIDMSERQFAANLLALQARSEAADLHSTVYRLVNWVVNLDAARLNEQVTALTRQLGAVEQSLAELRAKTDPDLHDELAQALVAQKAYRKQALDAVDLASVDPNTGVAAMQAADASYRQLGSRLDHIVAAQHASVEAATLGATSAAGAILYVLIGVGTLSGVATVMVSLVLSRRIVGPIGQAVEIAQSIATGNLSRPIRVTGRDEVGQLLTAMDAMQTSLTRVVGSVRSNAESVATASAQIAHGNTDLSARTEEQAAALEQTAASMEQLGATVKHSADNARQANQLALGASAIAVRGGEVVGRFVATMKGINDESKKIADIISVIDGIAFQTNILALNAAVEAARAGEQGRGFAVVASEVRSLAGRSAEAAREIKGLINASVERVAQGTALVDQAGATMAEVVTSIGRVTDIMGEISAASIEQSAGVAQVGEAVAQIDQAAQQNAVLVEESSMAAESLKAHAQQLVQAVAVFTLDDANAVNAPAAAPLATTAGEPPTRTERRSADRARNVTRPGFGARAKAAAAAEGPTPDAEANPRKSGTDGAWASF